MTFHHLDGRVQGVDELELPNEMFKPTEDMDVSVKSFLASTAESLRPKSLADVLKDMDDESPVEEEQEVEVGTQPMLKKLYEGPSECSCCKTWVEEYPQRIKKAVEDKWRGAAILARYAKSHGELGEKPLELYSITVQNDFLKSVVRDVLKDYPGIDTNVRNLTFRAPLKPFIHRWPQMESRRKHCQDEEERVLIDLLYEVLRDELGHTMEQADELSANGNITFELLFTLFPPGSIVFDMSSSPSTCCIVLDNTIAKNEKGGVQCLVGLCFLDHDGDGYGWSVRARAVPYFHGVRRISELGVVPRNHQSDGDALIEGFTQRGRRAIKTLKESYHAYTGLLHVETELWEISQQFVDGRIMVDPAQFFKHKPGSSIDVSPYPPGLHSFVPAGERCLEGCGELEDPPYDDLGHFGGQSDDDGLAQGMDKEKLAALLSDPETGALEQHSDDLLVRQRWTSKAFDIQPEAFCRPYVRGYCLQSKLWAEFLVDNISEIAWNEEAFDRLVMSHTRKRLLHAMVEQQRKHKAELDDVVRGKGQGLILLLSGPPGTGKTLTAESIADRLRMPLYAMDASQLGDTSADIEAELGRILRLAASWNAVLLLDEADAFLEKRGDGPHSLERNRRVAAFLRVLEYYKGVLILTTNRALQFDEAFYSRIHLSLEYPDLNQVSREKVWSNFLLPITDQITEADLKALALENMNGRQIKNVVKMARLLAENEDVKVTVGHLRDVIGVVNGNDAGFDGDAA